MLSARKTKALLAWLALHKDTPQPRDRLALLLWEDSQDAQARHSLRQALSGLRKALGDQADALATDQETVLLRSEHIDVDALQFENLLEGERSAEILNRAVSLYSGEFLEGFNPRSNTYEEWLMTQRSHYRERAMGAMSELLEYYLDNRQLESGVRLAIKLLSSDPLLEYAHRTLMELYVRLNRPADALRQYRQCRRVLQRELGVKPEPETVRLYKEIAQERTCQQGAKVVKEETPEHVLDVEAVNDDTSWDDEKAASAHATHVQQLRPVTVAHLHLSRYLDRASDDPELLHQQIRELLIQIEQLTRAYGGQLHHQYNENIVTLFGVASARGNECEKALRMTDELQGEFTAKANILGIQVGIISGQVMYDENW